MNRITASITTAAADAFPLPRDDDDPLPAWAWALIGASILIAVLWLLALIALVSRVEQLG